MDGGRGGRGDGHRERLIETALICGTVVGATWLVVRACDRNSRQWQGLLGKPVGDFVESLRFGHEEDVRRGPFWSQWGNFMSSIRGGAPPGVRGGVPPSMRGPSTQSQASTAAPPPASSSLYGTARETAILEFD